MVGSGPLRVTLPATASGDQVSGGLRAQRVVRALESDLTTLQIVEPSLEDVYLLLLDRSGP